MSAFGRLGDQGKDENGEKLRTDADATLSPTLFPPQMGSAGGVGGGESFVLRWNDFHANIADSFLDLRSEAEFFDVTLACDEEHQLQAHRVVLAASSTYFRSLLRRNPSAQYPVLVMPPTVGFSELASLLDFIYHGEVTVANEDLNALLKVANLLKVKGLVDEKQQVQPPAGHPVSRGPLPRQPSGSRRGRPMADFSLQSAKKRPRMEGKPPQQVVKAYREVGDPQGEPGGEDQGEYMGEFGYDQPGQQRYQMSAQSSNPPASDPSPEENNSGGGTRLIALQCPHCPDQLSSIQKCREHIRQVHFQQSGKSSGKVGPTKQPAAMPRVAKQPAPQLIEDPDLGGEEEQSEACDICDKVYKNRRYVVAHKKRVHKVAPPSTTKRGRPKKVTSEEMFSQGQGATAEMAVASQATEEKKPGTSTSGSSATECGLPPAVASRPVGQVQPALRSEKQQQPEQQKSEAELSQTKMRPQPLQDEPRAGPSGTSRRPSSQPSREQPRTGSLRSIRPPARSPHHHGGDDLKKRLGLTFGGQISITSSDQSPSRGTGARLSDGGGVPAGVSVTKYKGDLPVGGPVSVKDVSAQRQHSRGSQQQQEMVEVKVEPADEEEAEPYDDEEEDFEEGGQYGDYDDDDNDEAADEAEYGMDMVVEDDGGIYAESFPNMEEEQEDDGEEDENSPEYDEEMAEDEGEYHHPTGPPAQKKSN